MEIHRGAVILPGTIRLTILLPIHLPVTRDHRPEAVVLHTVVDHPLQAVEAVAVAETVQEAQVVEVDADKLNVDKCLNISEFKFI